MFFSWISHLIVPEPVYRLAEKEWKDFVEHFTELLVRVDTQVPPLPPKDVIHRIYRDVSVCVRPILHVINRIIDALQ